MNPFISKYVKKMKNNLISQELIEIKSSHKNYIIHDSFRILKRSIGQLSCQIVIAWIELEASKHMRI